MKRVLGVIGAFVILAGVFLPFNVAAQNTNNFRISTYDISYELSRDNNGRSVLETTEIITAEFPNFDQNRGLILAIPNEYDGHSVGLKINSVQDKTRNTIQYTASNEGDMTVLRIGNPDAYVRGSQEYRISYTQYDVTKFFKDNGRDEWYWDTNGTQWEVPIGALTVRAKIDDSLVDAKVGEPACYQGATNSTNSCFLAPVDDANYYVEASNLQPGENVTIALGFKEGTFTAYEPTAFERFMAVWTVALVVTSILAFIAIIYLSFSYARRKNRLNEIQPVAVEYIPPRTSSVLVSSQVITPAGSVFGAQLIDFAVRHFIGIIETKQKSFWSGQEYDIKVITDIERLSVEEQEILIDMFGHMPKVGDRMALKSLQNNMGYYKRTKDNDKKLNTLIEGEYAIREKEPKVSKFFYRWSAGMVILGLVTLSPTLLIMAGVVALMGYEIRPLTDKGLQLRRYMEGLKRYIKAAEVERLKFLQGPDTAQKIGESVDTKDAGQLVKLYERVLPYAILFGLEKDWAKCLGEFYETSSTSPTWYSGNTAFNAVVFASAMNNFSTAASYSGGSGSSSSGGSSGGGSSGGGGGGGGGGGW